MIEHTNKRKKKTNRDYYFIDAILKYLKNKISIYLHLNFEFDNFYLMNNDHNVRVCEGLFVYVLV